VGADPRNISRPERRDPLEATANPSRWLREGSWRRDRVVPLDGRAVADRSARHGHRRLLSGDELVADGFLRLKAAVRVSPQAFGQEVQEWLVVTLQSLLQCLRRWPAPLPFGGNCETWLAHGVEEQLLAGALFNKMLFWRAKDFHDASELFLLVLPGEDWDSSVKLGQDAAKAPHIDRHAVCHAKDDFRRPVKSRLNIRVHLFILKTAGSEVDDFDFGV